MLLCLGEPPVRCFCCIFISFLIFMLMFFILFLMFYYHLSMFFILLLYLHLPLSSFCCCSFTFSFRRHPSPFRGLSPGFYTHFILSAQPIAEWFATLSFSTIPLSSYRERYGFEWAFFTHRRFLPYAPSQHFWHNLLLSRPPWEPAVLPWSLQGFILILETQTRPICLFDSQ